MAVSGLIRVMERAARKAGARLRRDFGEVEHLQVSRKGPADFVSKADQAAERTLGTSSNGGQLQEARRHLPANRDPPTIHPNSAARKDRRGWISGSARN